MSYAERLRAALSPADQTVIARLAQLAAGQAVALYLVGGPVRDCLLGRNVIDLDLAVEGEAIALAHALTADLGGTLTLHERFGTAKWRAPDRDRTIDLATTRTETYARPGALPDVTRGTLASDLIRRDFTVNAMALRLDGDHFGELIDLHGGERDVQAQVVRVLHPRSFVDDPTRLFRAARFEQRFNWHVAPDTRALIPSALPVLDQVSGDRLRHELEGLFREPQPDRPVRRLNEWGVLQQIDPALKFDDRAGLRLTHPVEAFWGWAYWLANLPVPDVRRITLRLNLRREDAIDLEQVAGLVAAAEPIGLAETPSAVCRLLAPYHDRALQTALNIIQHTRARQHIRRYLAEWRSVRPQLDGTRLQQLGVPPGPLMGRLLRELTAARLDGVVSTRQDEEDYARRWLAREA
ncbi:MAG: CCA tRNA nucleotidyltransferase [Thermoflexales bacterium]|nr:CCA tRNA nucleotidyltransferase [Thermoflexales bacterium]